MGTRSTQSCQLAARSVPTAGWGCRCAGKGEEPARWPGLWSQGNTAPVFTARMSLTCDTRIRGEKDLHLPNALTGGHAELGSSPPQRWQQRGCCADAPRPSAATVTPLLKAAKPAAWQQLKRGSLSPAAASQGAHLQPQHPALFSLPVSPGSAPSPGAPICRPGSRHLQTQHGHLERVSRRPLFLYKFQRSLCCDAVFSFPASQTCS